MVVFWFCLSDVSFVLCFSLFCFVFVAAWGGMLAAVRVKQRSSLGCDGDGAVIAMGRDAMRCDGMRCARYKLTPAKLFSRPRSAAGGGGSGNDGTMPGAADDDSSDDEPMGLRDMLASSSSSRRYGGVGDVGSDHTDFFCSELVAAAFQSFTVLPPRRVASSYWPGSWVRRS